MKVFLVCLLPWCLAAQVPRVGEINLYGIQKVSPQKILEAAGAREGEILPASKGDMEERLEQVPGVVAARVEALCCNEAGQAILFIGVEEKGAPHFAVRSAPPGGVVLPPELLNAHSRYLVAVAEAARRGSTAEDLTHGHALMADPTARAIQENFLALAVTHLAVLRDCLRACADGEHRAMAATIIGYAPRKQEVLDDLQYAMQDPVPSVRANAMRSLAAIWVLAALEPQRGLRISTTWFVEMLNSLWVNDRIKAAEILAGMTEQGGAATLEQIRQRALPAIVEMARWKTLRYALPAFLLAGRLAGLAEPEIQKAWSENRRETVFQQLAPGAKKKR